MNPAIKKSNIEDQEEKKKRERRSTFVGEVVDQKQVEMDISAIKNKIRNPKIFETGLKSGKSLFAVSSSNNVSDQFRSCKL
jgi:hypothetical protein